MSVFSLRAMKNWRVAVKNMVTPMALTAATVQKVAP